MELNFQRTQLKRYEPVVNTVVSQEITAESIVPDAFPDVSRVVCTYGDAYITAKQVLTHSAKIIGSIHLHVLYIPENENMPRSISLEMPFQCSGDFPQIGEHDTIHANIISVCGEARLLNPRKLFAKAEVKINLFCCTLKCHDVICDLVESVSSIQIQKSEYKDHSILAVLEKPFTFSDTQRPSLSKPAMEELLTYHVAPTGVDARYIGNKLICKGIMLLSGLYRSGAELFQLQLELPFSQILEFEGAFDEGDPTLSIALKNVECTSRDGELDIVVDAIIQATVWSQQNVTMLTDLYSTAEQLDVERKFIPICAFAERSNTRESVRKLCETSIPAKQILMTAINLNPLSSKITDRVMQCTADAVVDLLYLSEDDALCGVSYTVPVACEIEMPQDCGCTCVCRPIGEVLAVPVTGGIEVRLEVEFEWQMTKNESKPCVTSAKKGSSEVPNTQIPSLIIRTVSKGESLWEVAKSCRSTVQDICTANGMTPECADLGTMLLIPTRRE